MAGASPPPPPELHYGSSSSTKAPENPPWPPVAKSLAEKRKLVWDLARGRCYWTGNILRDYGFHVSNAHPLLGCFRCHEAHPYTRRERRAVLLATSALTLPPSAIFGVDLYNERELNTLFLVEVLVLVTLPIMVAQAVLDWLSVLDLYVQRDGSGRVGEMPGWFEPSQLFAWVVRQFKRACLAAALGLSLLMLFVCVAVLGRDNAPTTTLGCLLSLPGASAGCSGLSQTWPSRGAASPLGG
eukprot:CAMPEP_0171291158 /NCGR_PEP_ID=MMETSP0790-20130122/71510_1 /TAXON_ID=2925 /ORGANISM="Alexandrium catenella, Strain OF101" /LENGTH=240 /DNA_ID=CAMNT_0011760877 /DNA_START=76 /DNA_END=796 /DNA_ORIENTATION=+